MTGSMFILKTWPLGGVGSPPGTPWEFLIEYPWQAAAVTESCPPPCDTVLWGPPTSDSNVVFELDHFNKVVMLCKVTKL